MLTNLILVINCGSSSLKFSIVNPSQEKELLNGLADSLHQRKPFVRWKIDQQERKINLPEWACHEQAFYFIVEHIINRLPHLVEGLVAIGHRVVHGGAKFKQAQWITPEVIAGIEAHCHFAPLHNPAALHGIHVALVSFPHLATRQAAVFDTSFHHTLPEEAYLYALPYEFYQQYHIRRYGFHGTSHRFVAQKAATLIEKPLHLLNAITCHLGNGSSVTAIRAGKSVDTSMGLTPLAGLVMGTRCGDIDPAIIFYLHEKIGLSMATISEVLTKESGLLGLSESTNDCRMLELEYSNNRRAKRAINSFSYQLSKYIAAYSTSMGDHLDILVFTGGIGENSAIVREQVLCRLGLLGFKLDAKANLKAVNTTKTSIISTPESSLAAVIPTNEALMIAQEVADLSNLATYQYKDCHSSTA